MSWEAPLPGGDSLHPRSSFGSVLCVCTYNQSRSVMMGALLRDHLTQRGCGPEVSVGTAGLFGGGHPPTSSALAQLGHRGWTVQGHVSRAVDAHRLADRDVVVTAERAHVVSIAGRWPEMFDRTFTLPELVGLLDRIAPAETDVWTLLREARIPKAAYLDSVEIGEIDEPGGGTPADWRRCALQIDALTSRLAEWMVARRTVMAQGVR
jgi:protein-tyrosine-phosphatase